MNYLAILWDEEHSYFVDEVDLPKVERAMQEKLPFKFSNGTIVAGADIKRIEKEQSITQLKMGYPKLSYRIDDFNWEDSDIRKQMSERWKH